MRVFEIRNVDNGYILTMAHHDGIPSQGVVLKPAHVVKAVKAWLEYDDNLREAKKVMAERKGQLVEEPTLRIG